MYTRRRERSSVGGRSTARNLVWLAFAGQAAFVASWITAGAVEPHYTHVLQGVSELATRHAPHRWIVTAGLVALGASFVALAAALSLSLWPGTPAATALHAGGVGVGIAVLSSIAYSVHGAAGGLIQRVDLGVMHVWVLIVGGGILYATRGTPRTSALIPMRPREFLARTWTGEGELVLRPFLLGRLFRQRVEARRESTWISEQVWRIDDEALFGGGRFERRHM